MYLKAEVFKLLDAKDPQMLSCEGPCNFWYHKNQRRSDKAPDIEVNADIFYTIFLVRQQREKRIMRWKPGIN